MPEGILTLAAAAPKIDTGNTAFMLLSAALVLLMTPGLAFFYGGMVRVKSVLNMLMMSFISIAIITILWTLYGFSIAFDTGNGFLGGFDWVGMRHIGLTEPFATYNIPIYAFAVFQLMFAIITPALISGALADRVKIVAWSVYIALWATLVYFPVAHWVWEPTTGWLFKYGVIDFAGGTAVHINAGAAALGAILVIRKRVGFKKDPFRPHNLPLVMLGAGLLWFGWFGFNAGSWLGADGVSAVAFTNTQVATAAAMLGWLIYERIKHGAFTTLGAASGAVAGLVAITPACGSVSPLGAIAVGVIAGVLCAAAVGLKYKFNFDDSLDVVGVHLVGGIVGSLLIGLFATGGVGQTAKGLFYGGGLDQLGKQFVGVGAVLGYSLVVSAILAFLIDKTIGFTVDEDVEVAGIDQAEHAETAYDFTGAGGGLSGGTLNSATATKKVDA
ncbi:ammonium transporter [Streptomyces prunicolor]|uniref:Ammonium transporter n=1 Tax=Streptomyces prunicolor TaxID=67348 RepID=A0ABU4FSY6_9ACTN|nr:ammonium transporter [Streptomyces prunicolor]MCX5237939.1 ammonium transporter [Streptomyces prunicolor]MDV7223727.1 ammonium transporter [Streptomyces prunicolor]